MGLSLAWVTCETSRVLLADGQVVFLRDLFSPQLMLDSSQMSEIILTDHKTQIKKKIKTGQTVVDPDQTASAVTNVFRT